MLKEGSYDSAFKLCATLTINHVTYHPLHNKDSEHYPTFKTHLYAIDTELSERTKRTQACH